MLALNGRLTEATLRKKEELAEMIDAADRGIDRLVHGLMEEEIGVLEGATRVSGSSQRHRLRYHPIPDVPVQG